MTDSLAIPVPTATPAWLRVTRVVFGLLIIVTVIADYRQTTDTLGNFLSFFTIQSNIFGAGILLLGATTLVPPTARWDYLRGAAMIFLALTGVVYNLLLRNLGSDTPPWINNTLHVAAPILMVADLLIDPLRHRLAFVKSLWWTVYPLAYAGYSLIRGPFVDWYPYGFLNPNEPGGWTNVIVHVIVIAAGFLAVSWVVVKFSNWRLDRERT